MNTRDEYYALMADREAVRRTRDFQVSDGQHPMTMGWARYRPNEARIMVRDGFGRDAWLTPTQHRVLVSARSLAEGDKVAMRTIANSIGVAGSTVSRAMLRLAALGLVAYDVVRGRYGGVTILSTSWADLKGRSKNAWAKLRQEKQQAWDRYYRKLETSGYFWSGLNVATIENMDATLTS